MILTQTVALIFATLSAHAEPSPGVVGWGNVLVPGLGATLLGHSGSGLAQAASEVGLFYGGTFGVREGAFTIDGSVLVPSSGNVYRPLIGQIMQEAGLKLHFYNTFQSYREAAHAAADSEREKSNPQPLYEGTLSDQLTAPFKWKNISTPWVYPLVLVSGAYLAINYANTSIHREAFRARPMENTLYGFTQVGALPFGTAMGEEVFFRGFIMREMRLYTNSAVAAIAVESAAFTLIHPNALKASALASGIFFGMMVNHFDGDLDQAITAHFWVNVFNGLINYWQFRRSQGLGTPFMPPVSTQISIPF